MNLILDTHIYLWWVGKHTMLSSQACNVIKNPRNNIYISAASVWEISIKESIGKLKIPENLISGIAEDGFEPLPITLTHADLAGRLAAHHKDPFDRMLIAQAKIEDYTLITHDKQFKKYDVSVLVA